MPMIANLLICYLCELGVVLTYPLKKILYSRLIISILCKILKTKKVNVIPHRDAVSLAYQSEIFVDTYLFKPC